MKDRQMNHLTKLAEVGGCGEDTPIRLFGIVRESIVDGPGLRFVVFVQGCPHHCSGCHNPASHDLHGGKPTTLGKLWAEIEKNPLIRGVTFSGGEPFLWSKELAVIGDAAQNRGLDVMTYTGYTYEHLLERARTDAGTKALLTVSNYLVDGRYEETERDLTLHFRGSRNQRIFDVTCYPNSERAAEVDFEKKVSRERASSTRYGSTYGRAR